MKPETLVELLAMRTTSDPDGIAFGEPRSGGYDTVTWREFSEDVEVARKWFAGLATSHGERIGVLLPTSLAFEVAQFGILATGAVVVGLDPNDSNASLEAAARLAHVTGVVLRHMDDLLRLPEVTRQALRFVVVADAAGVHAWRCFQREGTALRPHHQVSGAPSATAPRASDLATIVFTSGSTGTPKGLGYRHDQLLLAARHIAATFPGIGPGSRLLAWLPLALLFQRIVDIAAMASGATTYFVSEPKEVVMRAREVSPTLFIGVPRFFQKLRSALAAHAQEQPFYRRIIVGLVLSFARARGRARREGRGHLLVDLVMRTLLRKAAIRMRSVLGQDLRAVITGSAPMSIALQDELEGMGLPVIEAYGVTECVVPISMNSLSSRRAGSVGQVLPCNEVRLASDGEIEVRSAGLAALSLDAPLALTADGFLRTGDLGWIDDDGALHIVDRKASVFKLATGHKVAPVPIENALKELPWVDQVQVLGRGRVRPVSILWVDPKASPHRDDDVRASLAQVASVFPRRLQPAQYLIVPRAAKVDAGEITLSQKLRRSENERRFAEHFDDMEHLADKENLKWLPVTS